MTKNFDLLNTTFLVLIIIYISLLAGCSEINNENNHDTDKPNIIYIMADELVYGDLGSYGQENIQTPNLDRLAEEGMRFTQHYAGSTVCAAAIGTRAHTQNPSGGRVCNGGIR